MAERKKITISPKWEPDERDSLRAVILADQADLVNEEQGWRKTILWEAPCFAENLAKRVRLEQLLTFLDGAGAGFLENNRYNYSDYI